MTYLTERFLQTPILRSRFLSLALISLVLLALQATPARAQCAVGTACWTTTDGVSSNSTNSGNVGIGTASPAQLLHLIKDQNTNTMILVANPNGGGGAQANFRATNNAGGLSQLGIYGSGNYGHGALSGGESYQYSNTSLVLMADNASGVIKFTTGGNGEKMRIDSSGNVGIGTTSPSAGYRLDVNGGINTSGNINATGTITGGNIIAKYQDVAEWVPASEQIPAATVVVLDASKSNHVIASTKGYDTRVAGVISSQPGIALGEPGNSKVLVATTGRVIVKVDATRSPIHVGDLLVTGDVPGLAMKSEPVNIGGVQLHRPGTLIGKALEPLAKGQGEILVLLSLQ